MDRNATIIASALVVAATWLVNLPTLDYEFVHKDRALILERAPVWEEGWAETMLTRTWGSARKATLVSLDLDRRTPMSPRPYHMTNLVLATLVALLVFALARALGLTVPGAGAAGLLFTLHPLHVDAVVSMVGRAELLAATGVLAALVLHIRGYPGGRRTELLSWAAFALALLSRENAVVLLGLILVYEMTVGGRTLRRSLRTLVPYLVLTGAWLGLVLAQSGDAPIITAVDNPLAHMSAPWRIAAAAEILWRYLGLSVLPIALLPDRSFATVNPAPAVAAIAALAWMACLGLVWIKRATNPRLAFTLLWFPVAFAATSNLLWPANTNMAEQLAFLPSAGPCLLAGMAFGALGARTDRTATAAALLAVVVAASLLAPAYRERASVWAASEHYYRRSIELSPDSARAWYNLGMSHMRGQKRRLALRAFERAAEIMPGFDRAAWWRAALLMGFKRPDEAEAVYRDYLELRPDDAGMTSHLVSLLVNDDRVAESLPFAERMAAAEPDNEVYAKTLDLIRNMLTPPPELEDQEPALSP